MEGSSTARDVADTAFEHGSRIRGEMGYAGVLAMRILGMCVLKDIPQIIQTTERSAMRETDWVNCRRFHAAAAVTFCSITTPVAGA